MKRPGETCQYGAGIGASRAARWRSQDVGPPSTNYYTASVIECFYGERRHADERGQTMFASFPPEYDEFSKRIIAHGQDEWGYDV